MPRYPFTSALGAAVALVLTLSAPSQQLVRDIAQTGPTPSSQPRNFVALPTFACFVADTDDSGSEPWVTDGTPAGTFRLRDLVPGSDDGAPVLWCEHQGQVLFGAGGRLFLTDGTTAGTNPIPDLGIPVRSFVRLANGRLLAQTVNEVYATDLTAAGTQLVPGMRDFVEEIAIGGVSYGSCLTAADVFEVWATDGTVAGSNLVCTLPPSVRPSAFTAWNGRIYFQEGAFGLTSPLFVSSTNGVAGCIRHVFLPPSISLPSDRMFVRNNALVFSRGGSLLATDLTQAGTGPLNVPCTGVGNLVESGGALYFRAASPAGGFELWTTDGTAAGTSQVADLLPGPAGSHPEHLLATPGGLFFRALLPAGRRLLQLTAPATITDLGAIPDDAPTGTPVFGPVSGFVPFGGGLLFGGTDATGEELWRYAAGQPPFRLADVNATGPSLLHAGSGPFAAVRDRFWFTAYDGVSGLELWSTDGTNAGTQITELMPGSGSEFDPLGDSLARYGDRVALASRFRVAITDGTVAGTVNLSGTPVPSQYGPVRAVGAELYFVQGARLYHSNGTAAGTTALLPGFPYGIVDFEVLPGRIVLQTGVRVHGTDGTSFPQPLVSQGSQPKLYRLRGDAVVVTTTAGIFVTDGTPAGTSQLAATTTPPWHVAQGGGRLYVHNASRDVWETDGTPAGTFVATTVPVGMSIESLVATRNELFAVASTAATGRELWRLDRQTGQLVLTADLAPGFYSGVQSAAALGDGDLVFLAAGDESTGIELQVTDGTVAGTVMIADVHPSRGSSNPELLGVADDAVFFLADDGVHGREVWAMPLSVASAAWLQSLGFGCPGSAGLPRLSASTVPTPGALDFGFDLEAVRPYALSLLGIGFDHAPGTVAGCELQLAGVIGSLVATADLAGEAAFPLPLPQSSQLLGVRIVGQGFALDPLVPQGFVGSDGVIAVIGR